MPLPSEVKTWDDSIDPYDLRPFAIDLTGFLNVGESVASYTLTLLAESVLAGLEFGVGDYATEINAGIITFWPTINVSMQEDIQFYGSGVKLPMVLNFSTDSSPPRRLQRTYAIQVKQR